jgi:hypothetical protein
VFVICSTNGVRHKYGTAANQILAAVGQLGTLVDVSGLPPEQIQSKISQLAAGPACLIGGYDLIPAFVRANPTFGLNSDDDADIPTDAPYGATPGVPAEEYASANPLAQPLKRATQSCLILLRGAKRWAMRTSLAKRQIAAQHRYCGGAERFSERNQQGRVAVGSCAVREHQRLTALRFGGM